MIDVIVNESVFIKMTEREQMSIVVFDIGGSAVKYGLWENESLSNKASFTTPKSWKDMKEEMLRVYQTFNGDHSIEGVQLVLQERLMR